MATSRHFCPALNVEKSLRPFPRCRNNIFWEHGERGWHSRRASPLLDLLRDPCHRAGIGEVIIGQKRRIDRPRHPIDHDICEQFVLGESLFHVTATIAPLAEFLDHPCREPGRRIVQPVSQTLGTCALNHGVGSSLLLPLLGLSKKLLFPRSEEHTSELQSL